MNNFTQTSGSLRLNGGTISGPGTFTLSASMTGGNGGLITGGTTSLGGSSINITVSSGTLTIAEQITNGSLSKDGAGTLLLANSTNTVNNYNATTVSGGTLQLGATNQMPAGGTVTINSGATLDLGGFSSSIGPLALNGGTVLTTSGTPTLTATGGITSTGNSRITGGILSTGDPAVSAHTTFNVTNGTLIIDDSISGVGTSGSGGIIKNGDGTVVFMNTGNKFLFNGTYDHQFNAGTVVLGVSEVIGGHTFAVDMPCHRHGGHGGAEPERVLSGDVRPVGRRRQHGDPERRHAGHPGLGVAGRLQRDDGRQ